MIIQVVTLIKSQMTFQNDHPSCHTDKITEVETSTQHTGFEFHKHVVPRSLVDFRVMDFRGRGVTQKFGETRGARVPGVRSLRSLGCYKQRSQQVETIRLRNLHLSPSSPLRKTTGFSNSLFFSNLKT